MCSQLTQLCTYGPLVEVDVNFKHEGYISYSYKINERWVTLWTRSSVVKNTIIIIIIIIIIIFIIIIIIIIIHYTHTTVLL